jgi:hypothetical protein
VIPHSQPSQLDNRYTKAGIDSSKQRLKDLGQRSNGAALIHAVAPYRARYQTPQWRQAVFNRGRIVTGYYHDNNHRYYYSKWFRLGFFGGDWYPVRPQYDIANYFYYPEVFWMFYTGDDYAGYYNGYYPGWDSAEPNDPTPAPLPGGSAPTGFAFRGVFFPTDTLKDLGVEVSSWSAAAQAEFRSSMTVFVQGLQDAISNQLTQSIKLQQNEVVVNHYENLQDKALVVEGFDDRAGLHYSFKAFVDLQDPTQTIVFVPTSQDPTGANDPILADMNQRITALGGDPMSADEEPVSAGSPSPQN